MYSMTSDQKKSVESEVSAFLCAAGVQPLVISGIYWHI